MFEFPLVDHKAVSCVNVTTQAEYKYIDSGSTLLKINGNVFLICHIIHFTIRQPGAYLSAPSAIFTLQLQCLDVRM